MASGGIDQKIELLCLEPDIIKFESYENLNDKQLVERIGSHRNINIMSPMTSIRGRRPHYYYNQMEIEGHATPMGLGMVDGDTVAIWDISHLSYTPLPTKKLLHFKKRIIHLASKGDASSTYRGLNQVIGEQEKGFEFPLELIRHSRVCTSRDGVMRLSHAVKDTTEYQDARSWAMKLPLSSAEKFFTSNKHQQRSYCLLGLALIKDKMALTSGFKTICDLLRDLLPWINQCENEGCHNIDPDPSTGAPSPCREMEDIFLFSIPDIDTPGTCYRRLVSVSDVNIGLAMEWDRVESSVYVGPVRNSTSKDSSVVPIVRLVPYTQEATVQELVLAWKYYAQKEAMQQYPQTPRNPMMRDIYFKSLGLHYLIGGYHVTYNRKEIDMSRSDLIADVIDKSLKKHYFVITGGERNEWNDNRDISQLAEFVEGKTDKKDKKKKKKRKDSSRDVLERDQERTGKDGQVTSASLGPCPPAEVCGTTGSRGEKNKKDGKHKNRKSREKVFPAVNMEVMEKHDLNEKDEANSDESEEEDTRSSTFMSPPESPLASLKPLLINAAASSLKSSLDPVFDHIRAHFDTFDNNFFRDLAAVVLEVCLEVNESLVKLNETKLYRIGWVLKRYLNMKGRELQTLYSLQSLIHRLDHPDKLLQSIFVFLYQTMLISGEAFIEWQESTEAGEQEGKEVALESCTQFFRWLRTPKPKDVPAPDEDPKPEDEPDPEEGPETVEDPEVASNRENTKALEEELAIKEAKLQQLWDRDRDLVESTGKEMSLLISEVDDAEDEKHSLQKEVTKLESQMCSIRDQLTRLVKDLHKKDEELNNSLKKKRMLEDFLTQEVDSNKQAKVHLEREIEAIKARMEDMNKSKDSKPDTVSDTVDKMKPETQKLLFHINRKIEAKEADLECPVCLEVSRPPIYSCEEQHIICSDCRPKVLQ